MASLLGRLSVVCLGILLTAEASEAAKRSRLQTLEPSPSVRVTLTAVPPNPKSGDEIRFQVTLVSKANFVDASGILELPPMFELVSGDLEWTGFLRQGEEEAIEVVARAESQPVGVARFVLDLNTGEKILSQIRFGEEPKEAKKLLPPLRTAKQAGQTSSAESPGGLDKREDTVREKRGKGGLRPVDFTVVAMPEDADLIPITVYVLANWELLASTLTISLSPNLAFEEPVEVWKGDLSPGDLIDFTLTVRRVGEGRGHLRLELSSRGAQTSFEYPVSPNGGREAISNSKAAGPFTVGGRFVYYEDLSTLRGVYFARVEVYDDDGIGDDLVCTDTTDADGYWSCSGSVSDPLDDTIELYAHLRARNSNYGSVQDSSGTEYDGFTTNVNMPESGGFSLDFGAWRPPSNEDGAYHLLRMVIYGNELADNSESLPVDGDAHFLSVLWPDTDSNAWSEYSDWQIRIEGPGSTDPDEWDESVTLHEYGHYLMDHLAELGPPSVNYCVNDPLCEHSFDSHETPETAYIEGWADYYQSAVKRDRGMPNPHLYEESWGQFNLEASSHSPTSTWDDVESTTASSLWDINDSPGDDQNGDGIGDGINLGHDEIHDTFSFHNPPNSHVAPWDIHEFFTGFQSRNSVDDAVRRIFWEHGLDKDTAPNAPTSPTPAHQATGVALSQDLSWSANDPDGDGLAFTVRFEAGDSTPDSVACSGTGSSCDPGSLISGTRYFWSVTAKDPYGKMTSGLVWFFDTVSGPTCSYSINPPSQSVSSSGGPGSFSVNTQSSCPWSAADDSTWITITSGTGTGSGTVSFTVAPNGGSTPRTGHITVGGQTFTVNQAAASPVKSGTAPADFDGDGVSDWVVYRGGTWLYFGPCVHPLNETGAPMDRDCSPCVATVCDADSFCCSQGWDGTCVNEAGSLCQ